MKTLREIFSKQLYYYLEKNNMSVLELVDKLDVTDTTIYSWLNKKKFPRDDKIQKIAEIFNIPVENLITEPSNQQINNNNITNSSNFNIHQYNDVVNENRTLLEENRALLEENKHLKEEIETLKNKSLSENEIELLKIYNTLDFKGQIKLLNDLINN